MRGQAALKIVEHRFTAPPRVQEPIAAPVALAGDRDEGRPAWIFRGLFVVNLSIWASILLAIRALI